jgi:hypothetical protein
MGLNCGCCSGRGSRPSWRFSGPRRWCGHRQPSANTGFTCRRGTWRLRERGRRCPPWPRRIGTGFHRSRRASRPQGCRRGRIRRGRCCYGPGLRCHSLRTIPARSQTLAAWPNRPPTSRGPAVTSPMPPFTSPSPQAVTCSLVTSQGRSPIACDALTLARQAGAPALVARRRPSRRRQRPRPGPCPGRLPWQLSDTLRHCAWRAQGYVQVTVQVRSESARDHRVFVTYPRVV